MDPTKISEFMESPLLTWLKTLPDSPAHLAFEDLTATPFLHNVLQSFDANIPQPVLSSGFSWDYRTRVVNTESLLKRLQAYYEEVLGQCLVIRLPDPLSACADPPSEDSLRQLDKLLLLLVGAAVQCPQKEHFIASIKNLPVTLQQGIAEKIREVTDTTEHVWSFELDDPSRLSSHQRESLYPVLVTHVKRVVRERDGYARRLTEVSLASPPSKQATEDGDSSAVTTAAAASVSSAGPTPEKNHLALEVAEYKARVRKLNQQLEEKTEGLAETREELDRIMAQTGKLKQENLELAQEARAAKAFRDELDIVRERAAKVDKLEAEMQRYKDKITDIEFYKSRVEELREDNRILVETKEMLEEQLEGSRKRCESIFALENEILKHKTEINNLQLERESERVRADELMLENYNLQMSAKTSLSESRNLSQEIEALRGSRGKDTNILTEQIDKDVTRIHKLELENQKLQSELESVRRSGFAEASEKILDLEKENKKLSMTVKQLEGLHKKESDYNGDLEKEVAVLKSKAKEMEAVASALKESEQQLRIERDTEIDNLQKQVDSMRKRQQQSQNEQLQVLEEENKKLVKERTLLQTQVSKIEHEKKRLSTKVADLQTSLEPLDNLQLEKERLNSRLEDTAKELEELRSLKESHEGAVDSFDRVRDENVRLAKTVDKLRTDNNELSIEKARLSAETRSLARKVDALSLESQRVQHLETEREELRESLNKLRATLETLQASARRGEEAEQRAATAASETVKLSRQLGSVQKRLDELSVEHEASEAENRKLSRTVDTLKDRVRRAEQLEKENVELEGRQHKTDRENKSLAKEVDRLRQAVDGRDASIEDLQSKMLSVERERVKLSSELEQLAGESTKLRQLEQENRKLVQACSVDKRALVKLREELVGEKIRSDNLSNDLERLQAQLKNLGIDQSILDGETELISSERIKNLEGSMTHLLESSQKRISNLETTLKEVQEEKTGLQQEIDVLKLKVQAGNSRAGLESQLAKVVKERDQHQAEVVSLRMEANSSKEMIALYESKIKKLHEEQVKIEVENSTLQSQSTSLLSQINQLQVSHSSLEMFKRKAKETEKKWQIERSDLLRDQAGLQKLHDNLQQDYETLLKERDAQKDVEKKLRVDLRKLQSMSLSLSEDQDAILHAKQAIDAERESLRADARTLANLRSEHARLKDDFRSLFTSNERVKGEYCGLQTDYKTLKTSFNQLRLQHTEVKGRLNEAQEQLALMDVEHSKAVNRCEVLSQMNSSLEDDRKSLMSQVSILLTQYHELLTQTLNDKEHFHEEEKVYSDKMNNLSRQKEKLEEKIMEQYKKMDNSTPKKTNIAGNLVRKMYKASTNLMSSGNRVRSVSRGRGGANPGGASGPTSSSQQQHLDQSGGGGGHDSSSVGSNGSLDEMSELRKLSSSNGGGYRKQLESDDGGHNADDDNSVSSFSGSNFFVHVTDRHSFPDTDNILNQDVSQNISSHSEIGIPMTATASKGDNRARTVSRIYLNGSDPEATPKLTAWKSNDSSPVPGEAGSPPVVPSRRPNRGPPQRPPKPGSSRLGDDSESTVEEEENEGDSEKEETKKENTAWYEYGCV